MAYLSDYYNIHKGETCIILGNGPSLKQFDWRAAHDKRYPIIGTNRVYLSGHQPDYYVAVNDLVIHQFHGEITELSCPKFLPKRMETIFGDGHMDPSITWISTEERRPIFREHPGEMWEGHTVTYVALQLAFVMGFTKVILYGVDHHFEHSGDPNVQVKSQGPDPNHFHPDYFGKGVEWNCPDLEKSELAYSLAKIAYERAGRKIVNASHQTKLKTFPLVHPKTAMSTGKKPQVSAIVSAYYADDYLEGCLFDLMAQDLYKAGSLEIVVVYDGHSPEADILSSFGDDIVLVPTYTDIQGEGYPTIYKAWNLGIEASTGEYITNANCDDRHNPISMGLMAKILYANPHIDLVYHDQYITWDPNTTWQEFIDRPHDTPQTQLIYGRDLPGRDGLFHWGSYSHERLITGCFVGPQPMWRRSLHQRYGMFDPEFESAGDYEFWLRVAGKDNFFYISEPLGLYLAREDGRELKDPQLSAVETLSCYLKNTCEVLASDVLASDLVRFQVGGEFITTTPEGIYGMAQHVKNKIEEHKQNAPPAPLPVNNK